MRYCKRILVMNLALLLAACAAVGEFGEGAGSRPAKQPAPGAQSPATAQTVPATFRGIGVPAFVNTQAPAVYNRVEPGLPLAFPDFERPAPSAKSRRGKGMPFNDPLPDASAPETATEAWTGSTTGFDGIHWNDNGAETGFVFIPPDPHAAAGPDHLMAVTNVMIEVYDKPTGNSLFLDSLQDFFTAGLGPDGPDTFTFDPKVLYDQYADRWVVVTMEQDTAPNISRIFLAVSQTGDPLGTWFMTVIDSKIKDGPDHWADYPGFALDDQAIYITANLFAFGGGTFGGVRLWIIDKGLSGGLYDGSPAVVSVYDPYAGNGALEVTTQPTHMFGTPPIGFGTYLVGFSGIHYTGGAKANEETIQVVTVEDPLATPTFTLYYADTGDIETNNTGLPDAAQLGTGQLVEVNDRRALNAVWRNDTLWLAMTILPSSGPNANDTTAYWAAIDTTTLDPNGAPIQDGGELGGEDISAGTYTFFPSIAVDDLDNVVVGFSASDNSIHPGAYFVTRESGDAPGFTGPSQTVKAGVDFYHRTFGGGRNRWGDYSGTAVDSALGCFWIYNEWADTHVGGATESGIWGTAFTKTCDCLRTPLAITASEWNPFSLPCDPWPDNQVRDVFSGLDPGLYGINWIVLFWDAATNDYDVILPDDEMSGGVGYWIWTDTATSTENDGSEQANDDMPLESDAAGRLNLLGSQLNGTVDWPDFQVVDGLSTLTLDQADPLVGGVRACDMEPPDPGCVMSQTMYKWNGLDYDPFDGGTPGMEGAIGPYESFWVRAYKTGIELQYPATAAPAAIAERLDNASENAAAGPQGAREKTWKSADGEWFARLVVSSGGRSDRGNVFGQLADSVDGRDAHDLQTLAPIGPPWMSLLFTNPLLGSADWGFASDFRALTARPTGEWPFVVRASPDIVDVTLSWEGADRVLKNARLEDLQTGEAVRMRPGVTHRFTMDADGENRFLIRLD